MELNPTSVHISSAALSLPPLNRRRRGSCSSSNAACSGGNSSCSGGGGGNSCRIYIYAVAAAAALDMGFICQLLCQQRVNPNLSPATALALSLHTPDHNRFPVLCRMSLDSGAVSRPFATACYAMLGSTPPSAPSPSLRFCCRAAHRALQSPSTAPSRSSCPKSQRPEI